MNWQNVSSDPTWASIDNWYWRSWEVCIGIVAASIPALRPGYTAVTSSLQSYLSRRSTRKSTTFGGPIIKGETLHGNSDEGPLSQHRSHSAHQHSGPLEAASHAASAEVDRAVHFGVGDEGFAMKSLPGDKNTMNQGIKKTTRVDVDIENQRNLGLDGYERGEGGRYFV